MKNQTKFNKFVVMAIIVMLLSILACRFNIGNSAEDMEVRLQQTLVALQMTQTALENQLKDQSYQVILTDPTEPPAVVVEDPQVITQEPDVVFEGVSFSFDRAIANSIFSVTVPGQNMGEDFMPGETYPTHFEFTFENYAIGEHFHNPVIRVYPVDEFRAISASASDTITSLQQTLVNKPDGGSFSNLPFLPIWPAAQVFSAKVEYFDFQNGSGVRYLTMFGQALYPVDNQNLFYTYQGLTHDGRYYISAVLPVINPELPFDGGSLIEDYYAFEENWDNYIAETLTWLESQDQQSYFPGLQVLDNMMASFQVDR